LDYCDATKLDNNNFDIRQAENDIEFIKQSKLKYNKNPDEWVLTKQQQWNLL
jgi:hypothetical protein